MPTRKLPPLNSLRAFEAAARHLSFTKASAELFVTQAAVSHQIKHLEEYLDIKLFHRENRQLTLTAEGEKYWPKVNSIFEQLQTATEDLYTMGATGKLSISAPPTFAIEWLIPRVTDFKNLYPEIELSISAQSDESEIDFFGEDVDAAIYFSTGPYKKGVYSRRLLNEYLIPVCSPDLLEGEHSLQTPDDLRFHKILHEETHRDWLRWLKMVEIDNVNLNNGATYSHTVMVMQAAIHSQGVAIVQSILGQRELETGRLVRPFDIPLQTNRSYDFACPEGNQDNPKIWAFMDWIKQRLESDCEHDPLREGRKHILTLE